MRKIRHWAIGIASVAIATAIWGLCLPAGASVDELAARHSIPPGFDGHRWLYGLALAGLLSITSLALNVLIEDLRFLRSYPGRWREPAKLSSMVEALFLLTIVMGFAPDAIVLLAWGDPSAPPAALVEDIDRLLDSLCIIPFTVGWLIRARMLPVARYQLMRHPIPTDLVLSWALLRPKILMLFVIAGLSLGVAVAK